MTNRTVKENHEISPDELKKKIDDNEDIFILDVAHPKNMNLEIDPMTNMMILN